MYLFLPLQADLPFMLTLSNNPRRINSLFHERKKSQDREFNIFAYSTRFAEQFSDLCRKNMEFELI